MALSTNAVVDKPKGSLAFKLGNCSAIIGMGRVHDDACVQYLIVEHALRLSTTIELWKLLQSIVISKWLFGSAVECDLFDEPDPYCKLFKTSSGIQVHVL